MQVVVTAATVSNPEPKFTTVVAANREFEAFEASEPYVSQLRLSATSDMWGLQLLMCAGLLQYGCVTT